ncbi:Wadjet anti-phage system protein JetD domain-containing protein [Alicyclobacillus sp.]|uniref:Wadjet anti-phage system protein JetD domain-containing protein n=1 Tax=Alicyclobacillus sp. TaxID=61169 RepID=UPI0025BE568F|nr:Wadjet anti-phage system protein JetD domain-containing protein [Alicyclobacillus sp.]MCL6517894.1 DUF2220 domain-containing protein [Alicyclobacillus sp.]
MSVQGRDSRRPSGTARLRLGPEAVRVLSSLLDKYERSRALAEGSSARRPQVRMTDAVVPGYTSGWLDPETRRTLHQDLVDLADRGVVALRWVRFEEGNLLERVYLEWAGLADAYAFTGRRPLRDEMTALAETVQRWRDAQSSAGAPAWMIRWADDVLLAIRERGRVGAQLLPGGAEDRRLLLLALAGLVKKGEQVLPVRLFSTRYLGDSKAFERRVQSRLIGLLQRYALAEWGMPDAELFADPADLLREVGLETTHDLITFCGPVAFSCFARDAGSSLPLADGADGQALRGDLLPHGVSMDAADVDAVHWHQVDCQRILTIENKANYRAYVRQERRQDELVVYLGGFASPGQRRWLRSIRRWFQDHDRPLPPLHHWGDLDYGGILILQHLRDTCWPEAQPWRMEAEWLERHRDRLERFDEEYRLKLARLLDQERYAWAHALIRALLAAGGTLEQENLLVSE